MKQSIIKQIVFSVIFLVTSSLYAQNQISGIVNYHEDASNPLPDVTLELYDINDNLVATTLSNTTGEFVFTNIPSGEYFLRSSASLPVGDINLIDASLILQYLFGWYSFNDYEFDAADVNNSGNVTFMDYFLVLVGYIMQGNPFPTDNWQFEEVYINTAARDGDSTMVWGTSTGDVEGIWLPSGRNQDFTLDENYNTVAINEQEVEFEIGSNYNNLISGFNLNLTYPVSLIEITDVTGPDENFHFNIDENTGVLNVIWLDENSKPGTSFFGETLFRVKVKRIQNSQQYEDGVFSLLEGGMVLDSKSNQVDDISIKLPKFAANNAKLKLDVISYPNPVLTNLNLKITSPMNSSASISIYDLNGRLIQQTNNRSVYRGTQLITLNTENLPTGQYLYKVSFQSGDNIRGRFQKTN